MTDTPDSRRARARDTSKAAHESLPADTSLSAHESAERFVERLAARAPDQARYSSEGEIARGGMGAILRVRDEILRRELAMKVLLEREDDQDESGSGSSRSVLLARFLEEAQVTGQLDHPGVVPVHDMGVDGHGRVWFTMRLVKGRNLEEIIELVRTGAEGWTLTRAVLVLQRVCEAMAFAHSKSVVHRDLKPANIMVGRFGETYVMDWGLARVAGRPELRDVRVSAHAADSTAVRKQLGDDPNVSPQLTMAGSVVGTPAYMPPEQARGDVDAVDELSDVYAVGAMLYQLLAGHRPYLGPGTSLNAVEMLRAVVAGPPAALVESPRAPAELIAVCHKAMAREKTARYASMFELADDLQAYLEGRVVRAHRTGARAELAKWVARNRLAAGALLAAGVLAIAGSAAIAWTTHTSNVRLAAARDTALLQSYGSSLSAASASLTLGAVDEARRRISDCDESLHGWEWKHLALSVSPRARSLAVPEGAITSLSWSPDARRLALRYADRIEVRDSRDGTLLVELRSDEQAPHSYTWSPDGTTIAGATKANEVVLWNAREAAAPRKFARHEQALVRVRFSADGRRLYTVASNLLDGAAKPGDTETGCVLAWDVASGARVDVIGEPGAALYGLQIDPRGARIATWDRSGLVRIWDLARKRILAQRRFASLAIDVLEFEGDDILVATGARGAQLWDGKLEQVRASREDPEALAGVPVDWFSGGQHLASGRADGVVRIFDRHDLSPVATLTVSTEEAAAYQLSPDGRWFATAGKHGRVDFWNPELAGAAFDLPLAEWTLRGLAFTPDATRVVAVSSWGRIGVLDARTGELLGAQRIPHGGIRDVALTADGQRAAVVHEKGFHLVALAWLAAIARVDGAWTKCAVLDSGFVLGGEDGTLTWLADGELKPHATPAHAQAVSALAHSGRRVASAARDGSVSIWDASTRALERKLVAGDAGFDCLAFGPQGSWLAGADRQGKLWRWNADTGALEHCIEAAEKPFVALVADPQGMRLFGCAEDGLLRVWDARSLTSLVTLAQPGGHIERLALSKDGDRIACALDRGVVRILESRAEDLHDPTRAEHLALQREARGRVTRLAFEVGAVSAIEERLRADAQLPPSLRAATLAPLRALRDEARSAARQSWRVAQKTDEGQNAYRIALAQAERAWKLEPENRAYLEAFALALVRAGEAGKALELLEGMEKESVAGLTAPPMRPGTLAIRALARMKVGGVGEAREEAQRAREALRGFKLEELDVRAVVIEAQKATEAGAKEK